MRFVWLPPYPPFKFLLTTMVGAVFSLRWGRAFLLRAEKRRQLLRWHKGLRGNGPPDPERFEKCRSSPPRSHRLAVTNLNTRYRCAPVCTWWAWFPSNRCHAAAPLKDSSLLEDFPQPLLLVGCCDFLRIPPWNLFGSFSSLSGVALRTRTKSAQAPGAMACPRSFMNSSLMPISDNLPE